MPLETHFCFSPCALVDKRDLQAEMCAGCDGHWHSSTKKHHPINKGLQSAFGAHWQAKFTDRFTGERWHRPESTLRLGNKIHLDFGPVLGLEKLTQLYLMQMWRKTN